MDALADWVADNPAAAWHALNCADARETFADFCGMIEIPGAPLGEEPDEATDAVFAPVETPPADHHKLLNSKLQAVADGHIPRLMIFMPPGSAKSSYASVAFPPWVMGRRPRCNIGVATYATPLARKMGRRCRSIVRQPVYREIFGTGLSTDVAAANEWSLDNGNEFMGGGILSGFTGNRLDGLIVDDPVKGRQDADSPTVQKRTKEEFDDSLKTRLKPGGWIVLIQTRWNQNDLAGQILPENWDGESGPILCRDGLIWEVLCIPAQAEQNDPLGRAPGEMLWKEWFSDAHWALYRANSRTWSALYQQRPAPADGTFFQRAWFRRYRPGSEPIHLRKYLTSDHAPTDDEANDPSGCRVWGVAPNNDLYLLDGFNHHATMDLTADRIVGNTVAAKQAAQRGEEFTRIEGGKTVPRVVQAGLIAKHEPFAWFPEDDNNWKSAAPFILHRMRQEGARTRIEPMSPHGSDKATKAQSFQGLAADGCVWIPEGPEGDKIIDEYVKFPAGAHDEEVDMAGLIGRAITMAHPAIVPVEAPKPVVAKPLAETSFDELMAQMPEPSDRIRY